ncbi:hypothetical protein ES703_119591 [subsurface metagenome]
MPIGTIYNHTWSLPNTSNAMPMSNIYLPWQADTTTAFKNYMNYIIAIYRYNGFFLIVRIVSDFLLSLPNTAYSGSILHTDFSWIGSPACARPNNMHITAAIHRYRRAILVRAREGSDQLLSPCYAIIDRIGYVNL